jgi:hypothetical protein
LPGIECRPEGATLRRIFLPATAAVFIPAASDLLVQRTNLLSPSVAPSTGVQGHANHSDHLHDPSALKKRQRVFLKKKLCTGYIKVISEVPDSAENAIVSIVGNYKIPSIYPRKSAASKSFKINHRG